MATIDIDPQIQIRSYQPEDAAELFEAISASRAHLHPWLDWVDKTTKPEHSQQFIRQALQEAHEQRSQSLGIFYDGRIIGGIGMHEWHQPTRRAQVGYWITKEYEGKGIIYKCLSAFITYLFDKVGLNKIEIHFIPANTRSAKVAERLGCKVEGVIRQSVLRNGVPQDMVVAGVLRGEWKSEK